MSLRRTRKRRKASVTSLIDVIFLLLLFFMLASTFSKKTELELVSSTEGPASGEQPHVVRLFVALQGLKVNGHPIAEAELVADLSHKASKPNTIIAVELDDEVSTQRLIDILLKVRGVSDARIRVLEPS